jgi:hypothetical protein
MIMRMRIRTLLGLVLLVALALAAFTWYIHVPPWHPSGGMIGWSQAAIESKLGAPAQVFDYDIPSPVAASPMPSPPAKYRTLVFSGLDGHFVARLQASSQGYVCFRSSWAEGGTYY